MNKLALLIPFLLSTVFVFSQEVEPTDIKPVSPWKLKGSTGVNLSQTSLTNWSAGGENSYAGNAYLNGSLEYKKDKWLWTNALILEYGLTHLESQGVQKTADKIDFTTQLGYKINDKWYYSAMADFKSQFYYGYNYPNKDNYISKFMAPGYSNISLGIEYKPNDNYSAYFSPIAGKLTFVTDDSLSNVGAFGVDPGDKFKAELGAYLKGKAQKDIMENVKLITDVSFFTAYDKSFGNVDVEWNVLINMKINKYLNANLNTTLKYDDDVKYVDKHNVSHGARVQFKEILGIGFAYNF
ncbi:DUF3078 domain-containing protein [Dysgonomonas sp. 520]|uniref:DUF3078 domain-containing protein n=1 Tax=Dysgonomonas sp. 520 TaxID=2302931 RepID=UPI0013D7E26C|nr:DUF3078 domain-containing protein [Dysgonomonas sp. 520]NDW09772.1 DUF3078 domain-containing protein [Dysgonomonas sp. 520]